MPEDKDFEMKRAQLLVPLGVVTIDEAREAQGFEPLADGRGSLPRFGLTPLEGPPPVEDESSSVAVTTGPVAESFNGEQITSALELLASVQTGTIPVESARVFFGIAFPMVSADRIAALFSSLGGKPVQTVPVDSVPVADPQSVSNSQDSTEGKQDARNPMRREPAILNPQRTGFLMRAIRLRNQKAQ